MQTIDTVFFFFFLIYTVFFQDSNHQEALLHKSEENETCENFGAKKTVRMLLLTTHQFALSAGKRLVSDTAS